VQQVAAFELEQQGDWRYGEEEEENAKPETGQSNSKSENESRYNLASKNYAKQASHFLAASFSHSEFLRRFAMDKSSKLHTAKAPKNETQSSNSAPVCEAI
jgi:hypothetical protein